ncbi:PREDICTED: thyroid adenoma-associated protein isoform X1 [Gavialis gangeticus]|uniref:thyroid adenoma-associated protein isoform X1 n=1 Tax=Gavialis gangeticus TaxID=94835 RepID=UPI00092F511C|nr:PREDICTED: thyroid adenoma-associated protein isoform X1 [Gavialis gangeticus]XP_019371914.1 PREDICTED: thyroid adenoma-associated protein isoform X1 [Gavialis gangeticus]XP_019371915.1 PREDICTED: thyroid adenoma-associated protein isoform X1 [Gavialis gangeticus]
MVLKKKKEIQVDALVLDHKEVERLQSFVDVEKQNLASLLLHCVQLPDGIQQIQCIKQIVPLLKKMDVNSSCNPMVKSCLDILGIIYFSLSTKNPLKKVLASSLNGLPEPFMTEAVQSFICCLKKELETTDIYSYRKVLDSLASCMENFSLGKAGVSSLFKEVLQFLQKSLIEIQEENRKLSGNRIAQTQLMHDLLMAIKVSMMVVQKVQENIQENLKPGSFVCQSMRSLLKCFTNCLMDEEVLQTVQTTSGLAVVLFIKILFEPVEKLPSLVSDLLLRSVKCVDVPQWFMDSCGILCTAEVSDSTLLFLCHGALAMLEWKNNSMGQNGEKLLLDIVLVLLSLNSRLKESCMAMSLSRILAIWTSSALDVLDSSSQSLKYALTGNSDTIEKLLEYVYAHWEHPLDAVRHQTKLIFRNLLQIHQATIKGSVVKSDPFLSMLTENLLNLEWHVKGKYASLGCLVECVGIENILTVDRTIPVQILDVMGDQSLAPYASDLLETMFSHHKNHLTAVFQESTWIDQWHETWVSPLLLILCEGNPDQTTYVIDYYLPKLLKCNPGSLNYMIKILQASSDANVGSWNTRGALGALMACLRTARAYGHLQFADVMRDGLVSVGCIKQGLVHQHVQVRIDALGLLCETHRSTEIVSVEEMQLVHFFITYNLNSQSPAVRQQICSLLKKLFCRIQESSQLLYKLEQNKTKQESVKELAKLDPYCTLQQYKDFVSSVCDRLFEALFPGSSHSTRFSALTILGSIAEIFSVPNGQTQAVFQLAEEIDRTHVQTLIKCFASTFEEVKILAFELLRKLHKATLNLQDSEDIYHLFRASMDLSTSAKPYDCVTASYLLNFLIHRKELLNICLKDQPVVHNFLKTEYISAGTVEINTLAVVRLLLAKLEGEIFQAEKSLLQAAASFPLYGRVHCITGALQQLPLTNLTLMTEWKQMVTDLILISYKLSTVVAPVVQSSSPEGLIPMDTDSEIADRLQMILHEIQPRDTNYYFTRAKILKESCRTDLEKLVDGKPVDVSEDMRGKEHTCDVTAQMVLVCCWRSMKEVSLLLGMLCKLLPLKATSESSDGLITEEQIKDIGNYFKHHLLQSRHRGAFELAYTGFVKLTETLSRCNNERLQRLPEQWLCSVLEEIKSCDPSSKLCATRRSAGIPFYVQALLASEPKKSTTNLLKITMKELISLAMPLNDSTSTIPQVHALNILRALFRDTRLGENIIPYVADGIQAAILGFTSPVWAVRNASTLLFSALITRIFGVKRGKDENSKKNRMTGREFFSRFPTLYPFLLKQLEIVASSGDSEIGECKLHPSLFLLLLILGKLYPSPMDGTYSALSMAPFVPFIMRCGHSPVYRSREMAGRALVPFVMVNQIPSIVLSLLAGLPDYTSPHIRQNPIHGTLLQIFYLLQSYLESKHRVNSDVQRELDDIITCIEAKVWLAKRQNPCFVTRAAYLDILVMMVDYAGKSRRKGIELFGFWQEVNMVISDSELMTGIHYSCAIPGLIQYLQSITQLVIAMLSVSVDPDISSSSSPVTEKRMNPSLLVIHLLQSNFHEVRLLMLETLLLWWKQVNLKQVTGEKRCPFSLLSDLEEMLLKMTVTESHPQCFCKLLEILYYMDLENVLPRTEDSMKMNPKELLNWTTNIADTSTNIEIQSIALKFASKLVIHLVENCQEVLALELKHWVQLIACSCGDEQQTDMLLAAAEILQNIIPLFLTNEKLILGLSDTLTMWKCVVLLLQSEELIVRNAAAEVIRVAQSQETICKKRVPVFYVVNASMALDLAFGIICELLQLWNETRAGVPVLLEWLLGEDDLNKNLEAATLVEDDYLFDKGEVNFWAEKLTSVRQLSKHLLLLISETHVNSPDQGELQRLARLASEQARLVTRLLKELPPTPEFSKTVEFTRLTIQKERLSISFKILNLLQLDGVACNKDNNQEK